MVFANILSQPCTLHGYPTTAWFAGPGDARLAATVTERAPSGPIPTVTLAPGERAATTVWTDDPGVPSSSYCNPVTANAVGVELPGDAAVLTAHVSISVCSTNNTIGTTPITSGTAESTG